MLYRALKDLAAALEGGRGPAGDVVEHARQKLLNEGFSGVDYLDLRDAESLARLDKVDRPARLLAAVRLGKTRLIDNLPVSPAR
jgi:pantoate--beta-alanine ligase